MSLLHVELLDIDPGAVKTGTQWLDETYLPRAVASGDWGRARRFSCHAEPHLQLLLLDRSAHPDPADPAPVLASDLGRRWVRSYLGTAFARTSPPLGEELEPDEPEVVNAIVTCVAESGAEDFDRWYDDVHVPEILACPGWESARRFRARSGAPLYLALYGLTDPVTPFGSAEYERAVGWGGREHLFLGYHGFRTYRLENRIA
jgi:hypothetical protein